MTRQVAVPVLGLLILAGCAQSPAASAPPSASAAATESPAVETPRATVSVGPTSGVGAPGAPGVIVFDRYATAFGAEAPYVGTGFVGPDAGDERPLTVDANSEGLNAVWSPSGRRLLLYTWPQPRGPAIANPDGSDVRWLEPEVDGDIACSDWSPNEESLACTVAGFDPDADGIYVLGADGSGLKRLTEAPYHHTVGTAGECGGGDGRAKFSPDGERIAFIRQRCGKGANPSSDESAAIWVMRADGTALEEIVPQGRVMSHPGSFISWHGDWIAFGSQEGRLFVVHADGSGLRPIELPASVGQYHAHGPEWSPDGSRIAFSLFTVSEEATDLYSIAPDGSDLVRLTTAPGAEINASWGLPAGPDS